MIALQQTLLITVKHLWIHKQAYCYAARSNPFFSCRCTEQQSGNRSRCTVLIKRGGVPAWKPDNLSITLEMISSHILTLNLVEKRLSRQSNFQLVSIKINFVCSHLRHMSSFTYSGLWADLDYSLIVYRLLAHFHIIHNVLHYNPRLHLAS